MPKKWKMPEFFPFCSSGGLKEVQMVAVRRDSPIARGGRSDLTCCVPLRKRGDGITRALLPESRLWAQPTGRRKPQTGTLRLGRDLPLFIFNLTPCT